MSDYDTMEIVTDNTEVIASMQKRIEELEQECELISELSSNQDEALSKLEQQNKELVSYCEDLRKQLSMAGGAIEYLEDGFPFTDACKKVKENTYKLVAKTPKQSLAKTKADAIEEAVSECMLESDDLMVKAKAAQMMYFANKLREQS